MTKRPTLSATLAEFARTLITDFSADRVLDEFVARVVALLPVTSSGISLIPPSKGLSCIAASDRDAVKYDALQARMFDAPRALAYSSAQAILVPDLRAEHRFPSFTAAALTAGLQAAFTFPLLQDDIALGTLDLYRETPGALAAADLAAAQTLADMATTYVATVQAREKAHALTDQFADNALHDSLTGLPNRLLLQQRLEAASDRSQHSGRDAAVLFAGLDRFRDVNDTYGHRVGDQLLIAVARRLSALLRPGDTLARVSGDEFVVLCEQLHQASDVEMLANRIDRAFGRPFVVAGLRIAITASVGIAFSGRGVQLSDQLVLDADTAMSQAKRNGGGGHQQINLVEAGELVEANLMKRDLHAAFANMQLEVHYQPVVRSVDGVMTGVEALLRWTHPERGPIAPQAIIALAESSGLINEIGTWVLERACLDRRDWMENHPDTPLDMAVNVSTTQLIRPGFCGTVAAVLQRTKTTPDAVILEMTEDIFIEDSGYAGTVLSKLKSTGVRLALDDFGTGYSSLSYLRAFPVDVLKIDQTFLVGIGLDPIDSDFLAAVTHLAHVLGVAVTAEGVETQSQRDGVIAVGCESSQGYFYARPMAADMIAQLLDSHDRRALQLPDSVLV
ncbi:MAG: response regulator receiver modulated diguanylate cyclase/phosphodiesterase [Mycobacterium sp.]|jgi:diguanylate cyclase (GGDEF)-like protein|nr:response regulator receiver modulated diguanylate cyclase/phosphodiesterase [Mycobacterium sp.]